MNSDKTKGIGAKRSYLPWLVMGLLFLMLVFLNAFYLENWLDSDMAAEMMFSRLLAKEGHIFASKNWFYSTEFRFLYTQLVMGPLFRFLSDWHLIRMITNVIFYVLMLGSYFYMCKPLSVDENKKVWCGCALLLPFSETMMLHMHMGNTYISHVIICFLIVGMFLRISGNMQSDMSGDRNEKESAKKIAKGGTKESAKKIAKESTKESKMWVATILCYVVLSVICGVSGVRYMLALQCPLFLAAVWYTLREKSFHQFRLHMDRNDLKALWTGKSGAYIKTALLGMVCGVIGYGINVTYVSKTYIFQTYESTNFIDVYQGVFLERIQDAFGSIMMLFGYIPGKSVLSLRGIVTMIAFALVGLIMFLVIRTRKTKKPEHRFLIFFLASSFFLNTFVFVFTNSTLVPRYYITTLIFVIPVAAIYFTEESVTFDKRVVAVMLAVCLIVATGKTSLSMITVDKNREKREAAQFLVEQGYDFGYATYWNGNIMQELSDGALQLANISDPEEFSFFKWSSESAYYEPDYATGKVFLLLSEEEYQEYRNAKVLSAGEEIYHQNGFVIFGYESNEMLLSVAQG